MSSLEAEPFLHGEETNVSISTKIQPTRRFWESSALKFGGLVAYTILVSLAAAYIFHGGQNEGQAVIRGMLNLWRSICKSWYLQYGLGFGGNYFAHKAKLFIPTTESNYSGEPNPDKDAAWKQLVSQQMIHLTSSEVRRSGISTIPLQESLGFLATTTLWHELHCIVTLLITGNTKTCWHFNQWYLREALYQDYYHLNTSAEEARIRVTHSGTRLASVLPLPMEINAHYE